MASSPIELGPFLDAVPKIKELFETLAILGSVFASGLAYRKTTKMERETEYGRLYGTDILEGVRKSKDLVEKITATCMASDRDTLVDEAKSLAKTLRDNTVKLYIATAAVSKNLEDTDNIHETATDLIDLFAACLETIANIPAGHPVNQDNIQRGQTLLKEATKKIELIQLTEHNLKAKYPRNKNKKKKK